MPHQPGIINSRSAIHEARDAVCAGQVEHVQIGHGTVENATVPLEKTVDEAQRERVASERT